MRYTDSEGSQIEIDDNHLDVAIEIYEELKKLSPSGIVSWRVHKRMMEDEGFLDSDKNENYRCMIKEERKKRGLLPSVVKHAEMINENKLETIRKEIGEIRDNKLQAQQDFLKLNKLKRELSKDVVLIERIESALKDIDFSDWEIPPYKPVYSKDSEEKFIIVGVSDIHFGAIVDLEGREYNVDIAEKLMMGYADKIIDKAHKENARAIHVVNLGDLVEGLYMRTQNLYSAEKTFSEQVVDASELIIKFLTKLSGSLEVSYTGISGNHDRISSKNDNIYSDSAIVMSNKIIQTFIKYAPVRVEYIESEPYHHIFQMNGKNFLFVHGDRTPMKKDSLLAEQSVLYGIPFDAVIGGHVHHFSMREVSDDKFISTFGSVKGSDEFTLKTLNTSSARSQGLIIIGEDGEFEIKRVKL